MNRREGGEQRAERREPRGGREDAELGRREESGGSTEEGSGEPRPLAQGWPPTLAPAPAPRRAPGRTCRAHTPPARRAAEPPSPPSARTRGGSLAQPSLGAGRSHHSRRRRRHRRCRGTAEPARCGTQASPGWALGRAGGRTSLRRGRSNAPAPPEDALDCSCVCSSALRVLLGAEHSSQCGASSFWAPEHPAQSSASSSLCILP